ncbi:MAG: hypothetical protein Q9222_004515, partial [Ikaeria aurantiellina]
MPRDAAYSEQQDDWAPDALPTTSASLTTSLHELDNPDRSTKYAPAAGSMGLEVPQTSTEAPSTSTPRQNLYGSGANALPRPSYPAYYNTSSGLGPTAAYGIAASSGFVPNNATTPQETENSMAEPSITGDCPPPSTITIQNTVSAPPVTITVSETITAPPVTVTVTSTISHDPKPSPQVVRTITMTMISTICGGIGQNAVKGGDVGPDITSLKDIQSSGDAVPVDTGGIGGFVPTAGGSGSSNQSLGIGSAPITAGGSLQPYQASGAPKVYQAPSPTSTGFPGPLFPSDEDSESPTANIAASISNGLEPSGFPGSGDGAIPPAPTSDLSPNPMTGDVATNFTKEAGDSSGQGSGIPRSNSSSIFPGVTSGAGFAAPSYVASNQDLGESSSVGVWVPISDEASYDSSSGLGLGIGGSSTNGNSPAFPQATGGSDTGGSSDQGGFDTSSPLSDTAPAPSTGASGGSDIGNSIQIEPDATTSDGKPPFANATSSLISSALPRTGATYQSFLNTAPLPQTSVPYISTPATTALNQGPINPASSNTLPGTSQGPYFPYQTGGGALTNQTLPGTGSMTSTLTENVIPFPAASGSGSSPDEGVLSYTDNIINTTSSPLIPQPSDSINQTSPDVSIEEQGPVDTGVGTATTPLMTSGITPILSGTGNSAEASTSAAKQAHPDND